MTIKKKILTSTITGILLLTAFTPAAFAHDWDHTNRSYSYDKGSMHNDYQGDMKGNNAVYADSHSNNNNGWANESSKKEYDDNNNSEQYNAVDKEYMQMIIPHHREAIAMAEDEISRGSKPEVKTMAEKIKNEQMMGLEKAENLYREVFGEEPPSGMTETVLPELKNASDVDHTFLSLMIKHHAGGTMHAHKEINEGENDKVKQFAHEDIPMQTKDIDKMAMMLHELYN